MLIYDNYNNFVDLGGKKYWKNYRLKVLLISSI